MTGKHLISISTVLALVATVASAQQKPVLRFATEGAFAPWNFVTPGGELNGFEIDLINDLCSRMERECTVSAQAWDGIIPGLELGKYDVITASMNINEKRLEVVDFSTPYASATIAFAALRDSPLMDIGQGGKFSFNAKPEIAQTEVDKLKEQLKGLVLGVQSSTGGAGLLEREFQDIAEVRFYKKPEELVLDLQSGRIDAALAQQAFWAEIEQQDPNANLTTFGPQLSGGKLGIGIAAAIRKNEPELKADLDKAIHAAIDDGTIRDLSIKWLHTDVTPVE